MHRLDLDFPSVGLGRRTLELALSRSDLGLKRRSDSSMVSGMIYWRVKDAYGEDLDIGRSYNYSDVVDIKTPIGIPSSKVNRNSTAVWFTILNAVANLHIHTWLLPSLALAARNVRVASYTALGNVLLGKPRYLDIITPVSAYPQETQSLIAAPLVLEAGTISNPTEPVWRLNHSPRRS
ncbi:hypothetical protein FRC09_003187 [Ceratobasidium sp. 395]|nr:hypothetical protein FRC09_003187 [Ceratobasidium sp. 395]